MSEVSVRLSELRHASENLRQSAYRLQVAVDNVIPLIDQSLIDVLHTSENAVLYQSQKANIATLPAKITQFADNLQQAADDIDKAVAGQTGTIVHFYAPVQIEWGNSLNRSALLSNNAETAPSPKRMSLDEYVSPINRPLYDKLQIAKSDLKDKSSALALLINQRKVAAEDLTALKNRMLSFDPSASVESNPRVIALQTQLDNWDVQIEALQTEVDQLQIDVNSMTERLERVAPGPGAELDAILALEGAENPQWMKDNTFDCVRYVVDKLPLPGGVPRDALLWDDAALELPQYGITWGDVPLEGSVLQMDPAHSFADDTYGHVLYVERVDAEGVWVTDYQNFEPIKLSDLTTEVSGENMRYLYFPWNTKA